MLSEEELFQQLKHVEEVFKTKTNNEAYPLFLECLCTAIENGNLKYEAITLSYLGIIYSARKEYDRAVTSFERAIDIFSALGMEYEKHLTLSYSSQTYIYLGNYPRIVESLKWKSILGKTKTIREESNKYLQLYMKELLEFDDHVFAQDEGMKDLFPTYHNPYKFNFLNKLWFEYDMVSLPYSALESNYSKTIDLLNNMILFLKQNISNENILIDQYHLSMNNLPASTHVVLYDTIVEHYKSGLVEKIKYHKSVLYRLTKIVNALPLFIDFYQYKLSTLLKQYKKWDNEIENIKKQLYKKGNDLIILNKRYDDQFSSSPLSLSSFNDTTSAPLNEPIRTSLGGSKEKSPVIIRQSVLQLESSLDQCTNKLRSTLTSLQKWYILLEQEKELIITEIFKTLRDMDNDYISILQKSVENINQGISLISTETKIRLEIHHQIMQSILKNKKWEPKTIYNNIEIANIGWLDKEHYYHSMNKQKNNEDYNYIASYFISLLIIKNRSSSSFNQNSSESENVKDSFDSQLSSEIHSLLSTPFEDIPEAEESEEYDHFSSIEEIYSASTLPVPTILEHCESSLSLTSTENLSSLSLLQESNSETGFSYDDSQEIQSLNTYSDTTIPGRMYVYTTYKEGRDLILRVLTDLRSNPLIGENYHCFLTLFELILENIYKWKDIHAAKQFIILGQTYKYDENGTRKELFQSTLDHPIWKDNGFWEEFFLSSVREDVLNLVTSSNSTFDESNINMIIVNRLNTTTFNMKLFNYDSQNLALFIKRMGYANSLSMDEINALL